LVEFVFLSYGIAYQNGPSVGC